MSIFLRSKLTEALRVEIDKNKELFDGLEDQRKQTWQLQQQVIALQAKLDGAEEALAEAQDKNGELNRQLQDMTHEFNDLMTECETMNKTIINDDWVLEKLNRQNALADEFVTNAQEQMQKDFCEWRHDWTKAREAEALEEENLRLWAENAILRGKLAQMDPAAAKECVSDRP